jgi:hypothetical protein
MSELADKTIARAIRLIMLNSSRVKTSANPLSLRSPGESPRTALPVEVSGLSHLLFVTSPLNHACSSCEG